MNRGQKDKVRKLLKMKRCRYCKSTKNLTIDHKIPLIHGGTDDIKNLQCLCKRCNGMKSGMSDRQVRGIWRWLHNIEKEKIQKTEIFNKK